MQFNPDYQSRTVTDRCTTGIPARQRSCRLRNRGMGAVAEPPHPSPAVPLANRDWAEAADRQLAELGIDTPDRESPGWHRRGRSRLAGVPSNGVS